MASRPNPSWSEPQKQLHKVFQEAQEIVIPYSGPEIPRLDNHTPEQVCDQLGVVKALKSKVDAVEKILKERFKPMMGGEKELRGTRYVATMRNNPRVALDQQKVKEFLQRADDEGIDVEKLLDLVIEKRIQVPNTVFFPEDSEQSNQRAFNSETDVATLNVKAI